MKNVLEAMKNVLSAVIFAAILALVAVACTDAPTAATEMVLSSSEVELQQQNHMTRTRQVLMLDACDPASFNEAFGFEVCNPTTPRAGIHFDKFISLLQQHQEVNAWRFSPDVIHVPRETVLHLPNRGGIEHSFTEVEEFGGGFVPILNQLAGTPVPAPECVHPEIQGAPNPNVRFIAPGDHDEVTVIPGEETKYMCCIHPWMRATAQ